MDLQKHHPLLSLLLIKLTFSSTKKPPPFSRSVFSLCDSELESLIKSFQELLSFKVWLTNPRPLSIYLDDLIITFVMLLDFYTLQLPTTNG